MRILASEDRVLCLAALLKYQARLKEIIEMLPPDPSNSNATPAGRAALSEQQLKDEFQSLAPAEYELAAHKAKREFGSCEIRGLSHE